MSKEKDTAELAGSFSLRLDLQSLVGPKLGNFASFALKVAIMQGIEDTLVDVVYLGFLVPYIGVKKAFFQITELALSDTVHHELMKQLIHKRFEPYTQSEAPVNKLAE